MTTLLSIALLIIGTAATLAAFGGKTWKEGPEPVLERVTARGWISLVCLALALFLSVIKEIENERENAENEAAAARSSADAQKRQDDLALQLTASRAQLELANKDLEKLNERAATAQDRLDDTKLTLGDVRKTLNSTRDDLDESAAADLQTAFVNAHQQITDLLFILPLMPGATSTHGGIRDQLLPAFTNPECRDLTGLNAKFRSDTSDDLEEIKYEPGDTTLNHLYAGQDSRDPPKSDLIGNLLNPGTYKKVTSLNYLLGQQSAYRLYQADIHTAGQDFSAAQMFGIVAQKGVQMFVLTTIWPAVFQHEPNYTRAKSAYPSIFRDSYYYYGEYHINKLDAVIPPFPKQCATQVRDYFRRAFRNAVLLIVLGGDSSEVILVKLKPEVIDEGDGMWGIAYSTYSPPVVQGADAGTLADIRAQWPK